MMKNDTIFPVRKRNRLSGFDYSMPNAYFITICTHQRENLLWDTVVAQMKGVVSKRLGINPWQKGLHDHIVRTEADYREIWTYIDNNPIKWTQDALYKP